MTPFVGSDPIPDAYQFLRNRHKGWNNAWDSKILAFRRHDFGKQEKRRRVEVLELSLASLMVSLRRIYMQLELMGCYKGI